MGSLHAEYSGSCLSGAIPKGSDEWPVTSDERKDRAQVTAYREQEAVKGSD
jgi:hypothetical protein